MRPGRLPAVLLTILACTSLAQAKTAPAKDVLRGALLHPRGTANGTVIFFHGFSAKPTQWLTYAKWLHEHKGFDVIAVPLPGHDLVQPDQPPDLSRIPRAAELDRYLRYNEAVFRLARSRGKPIHVVGMSAGGAQALWMALRHGHERQGGLPLIRSVTAVNPFLESSPRSLGRFTLRMGLTQRIFDVADKLSFGGVSSLADRVSFDLATGRKLLRGEADEHVFQQVQFGHVVALHRFGQLVLKSARRVDGPRFRLFLSDDPVADPKASLRFARIVGAEVEYSPAQIHNLLKERSRFTIFSALTRTLDGL